LEVWRLVTYDFFGLDFGQFCGEWFSNSRGEIEKNCWTSSLQPDFFRVGVLLQSSAIVVGLLAIFFRV
jgi:hypothetical protein